MKPIFNKQSIYYNITYVSGSGRDTRVYRFQLGQYLPSMDAFIYDIVRHVELDSKGALIEIRYIIYIYSKKTNEIVPYKDTNVFSELSRNINYLLSEE